MAQVAHLQLKTAIKTFSVLGDVVRAIPGPSPAAVETGGEDDNDT